MNSLNDFAEDCHAANATWWINPVSGAYKDRNIGELLMLCVCELAEACEGHRKGLKDDYLPQFDMFDVELVDTLIRIFDLAGARRIDLDQIYAAKMAYNANRADHKLEARMAPGGKKY